MFFVVGFYKCNDRYQFVCEGLGVDVIILLVYVNDMVLISNKLALLTTFFSQLHSKFALKNIDALHYFLGIEVSHSFVGLFLCQHKYVKSLLSQADSLVGKHLELPWSSWKC